MEARLEFGSRTDTLRVCGEIDVAMRMQLRSAIAAAANDNRSVVLDLTRCTFMDSSGVHEIEHAAASGIRVELRGAQPAILALLAITGVDRAVLPRSDRRVDH